MGGLASRDTLSVIDGAVAVSVEMLKQKCLTLADEFLVARSDCFAVIRAMFLQRVAMVSPDALANLALISAQVMQALTHVCTMLLAIAPSVGAVVLAGVSAISAVVLAGVSAISAVVLAGVSAVSAVVLARCALIRAMPLPDCVLFGWLWTHCARGRCGSDRRKRHDEYSRCQSNSYTSAKVSQCTHCSCLQMGP